MPEIEILRVHGWPASNDEPTEYTVDDTSGYVVQSETTDFGVNDLAELATEHGITRWAEATDKDRENDPSYSTDKLVLVGWADAPIGRDDVQRSYHREFSGQPMVNVKVQDFDLPAGEAFDDLVSEHELDTRLAALPRDELRTLINEHLAKHDTYFQWAGESGFEAATSDAIELFSKHSIKVWSAGRSGGWLVVEGLPNVDSWGVELLTKWKQFTEYCEAGVKDIPRSMAWHVLANNQDELAGRVIRVELTMVLSDDDLDKAGTDVTNWNWRDMLDLDTESTITIRQLP